MSSFDTFVLSLFFFTDTATTEIYTLSLHDAFPIYIGACRRGGRGARGFCAGRRSAQALVREVFMTLPRFHIHGPLRSEEHTSELQSHSDLVCRLLLEKKKKRRKN